MDVRVEYREKVTLIGMEIKTYGIMKKGEPNSIPGLWEDFNQVSHQIPNLVDTHVGYGLIEFPRDWQLGNRFLYTAAVAVSDTEEVPEGMVVKEIPAQEYAVVRFKGTLTEVGKGFNYFYNEWLPESGYKKSGAFEYEYYGKDFKGDEPESILEVHFPIVF
ncbi:GyrI-like domain-containing protein [Aquisalibacillus elongatus]|uniref:AraC family transcriptional regulator n=1 Tax=Aquisalibacillus elongatus TaxID=485577 RepID=A0A3N5C541_9BACI|nr:GyrI-like domain-containing protein [Aquisalibacillus elongatus]RPF53275.1 AraC family transcriptional regulator [Aquisalibacillus elongatus]